MNHYKSNILGCLREFGLLLPPVFDQQFYWIRRRHGADYRRLFSWPLLNLCGKRISVFADASHPNYSVEDTWAWGEPSDFDNHFEIEYSDDLGSPADWYYRFFGYRCMIRWNVLPTWLHNHAWGWELVPAEIVHMMLEVDWPLSKFYGWHHDYQYFPNGPPDPTNPYFTPSDNVNFHDVAEEVPESRIRKITGPGPTATEVVDRAERVQHDALMEEGKCAICYRQFFEDPTVEIIRIPCQGRHIFDKGCIFEWLEFKGDCPLCRERVCANDSTYMDDWFGDLDEVTTTDAGGVDFHDPVDSWGNIVWR